MLHNFSYWIVYRVFYGISLLPYWLLYGLSNIIFFLLFYVLRYRRQVAYDNLRGCFPEKSEAEIHTILRESYVHLADMFVEFFKGISITQEDILVRMQDKNPALSQAIDEMPEGIYALATHYCNFEWTAAWFGTTFKHKKICAVYQPLNNKLFHRLVVATRERWHAEMLPMRNATQFSVDKVRQNYFVGTLCDQSPTKSKRMYFTKLFNRPTAAHYRFAHVILKDQLPTCYLKLNKVKRGHYSIEFKQIDLTPFLPYTEESAFRLVDYYNELLEANIKENPAYWLWTHKKWKHSPTDTDRISKKFIKK